MLTHQASLHRRGFLKQATLAGCAWGSVWNAAEPLQATPSAGQGNLMGVNIAGAEFGAHLDSFCSDNPGEHGREYTYGSKETIAFFCDHQLSLMRVPFRWERIQPQRQGPLNLKELARLKRLMGWVQQCGGRAVLDVHNYGRFKQLINGSIQTCTLDATPLTTRPNALSGHDLSDLWCRLARVFGKHPAVVGYGLMNEPHDLAPGTWQVISNHVVRNLRRVDPHTSVIVSGDSWGNPERFAEINGAKPWIDDPAENTIYEAHCYFDHDSSGKYRLSFEEELVRDPGLPARGETRILPFLQWCKRNRVRGFVGEFGVPATPKWLQVLQRFARLLRQQEVPGCYWAAGEYWGSYPLSIQPRNGRLQPQHVALVQAL